MDRFFVIIIRMHPRPGLGWFLMHVQVVSTCMNEASALNATRPHAFPGRLTPCMIDDG